MALIPGFCTLYGEAEFKKKLLIAENLLNASIGIKLGADGTKS